MGRFCRFTALLLIVFMLVSSLAACSPRKSEAVQSDELHIYASFYPLYALCEALADGVEDTYLHCLVQPQDGCLRDYQLSDWDLALLMRSADMMVIGGRGLESFENALYSLGENGPAVASVLYNKELVPAMIVGEDDDENHWQDLNPHLYMSAEGASLIAESIAAQLTVADPANAEIYIRNLENFQNRLRSVSGNLKQNMVGFENEPVILMNETAVYIAQEYQLEVELCVNRDSGEAYYDYELEKLLAQLEECKSRVILIEKQAPERFCEALEGAGFTLARIDTLSAKRAEEGLAGYLSALQENAAAVAQAFEAAKTK